jgi:hypothetical protein
MDRLTEHDLLALIEGDLPPDRVPVVEAALRADPALVKRIQKMKEDRAALGALGARDRAPAGIAHQAIAHAAAQPQYVQVDTGAPVNAGSLKRGSHVRRVQMAVAACVGLALVGVWVALMLMVSSPTPIVDRPSPEIARADVPGDADVSQDFVGPLAPEPRVATSAPSVREMAPEIVATEDADESLLDEWMANLDDAAPESLAPDGLGYREAARLALDGRLRISIIGDGPSPPAMASDSDSGAPARIEPHADRWRTELRYRADTPDIDLALAIERLVTELEARTGREVRLAEADEGSRDAEAAPTPLAEASAILWWGASDEQWARRMVVRPLVSYEPEPAER